MTLDPKVMEAIGARMAQSTPQAAALNIRLVSVEPGVAAMAVPWSAELVGDPATGVMAGGVITTLLDQVCGLAVSSLAMATGAAAEFGIATLDLRIDYMRSAEPGREVIALARCYRMTKSVAFVRAAAFEDEEANPVATVQATFTFNRPSQSPSQPSGQPGAAA